MACGLLCFPVLDVAPWLTFTDVGHFQQVSQKAQRSQWLWVTLVIFHWCCAHFTYPLVNIQETMGNQHFNWKTHFLWPCSIVILNCQRVVTSLWFAVCLQHNLWEPSTNLLLETLLSRYFFFPWTANSRHPQSSPKICTIQGGVSGKDISSGHFT